jgi:acyl carrier protein
MQREDLRSKLHQILVAEMDKEYPPLEDGLTLTDELGLDSMDMVTVVMRVEQQLRIRLAYEELSQLATVGELLNLIQLKLKAQPQLKAG